MRICFLIPDGVGIRNYLYSEIVPRLFEDGHKIILWHSLDPKLIHITEERLNVSFEQYAFKHLPDNFLIKFIRDITKYSRLKLNSKITKNETIMDNWSGNSSSMSGNFLMKGAQFFGSFISSYNVIISLENFGYKLIRKTLRFKKAKTLIESMKPDIVFCTHQRIFSVSPEIEAAKSLGIKTATAIFSWDNLPKGILPFRVDQYFVWSDYMKEEMAFYYPEINSDSVVITGTPQFDFYFKKNMILPRDEFAIRFKLDPKKSWVCFSGSDSLSSPNDPMYLADVANALNYEDDIQLIFRPVPVESSVRYNYVLNIHSKIVLTSPKWNRGNQWGNFFPYYEDFIDLVNLAYHSKIVLNLGSTMALDFSVFGNLAFFLKYEHEQKPENWSIDTIYRYQHFQSMKGMKAVGFIFSPEEILEKVKGGLLKPDDFAPDRMKWFQKVVQPDPRKSSSHRVADALISLISLQNN
jgi:hypothetical protein